MFEFTSIMHTGSFTLETVLLTMLTALVLGVIIALVYRSSHSHTSSFAVILAVLPVIESVIIMLVNGNLGTSVAVLGAFSLVRFRSAPGSARDIVFIFLAMSIGLVAGMGYLVCAAVICAVLCLALLAYQLVQVGPFGETADRTLRITVPEDLDFTGLFDDILDNYCTYHELQQVKTTNMGSLYRLVYDIGMRDTANARALIDELRCRNGNLEIAISHQESVHNEL